jgi:protein transport protein SEC24
LQSICVELKHDDKLTEEDVVYLQAAILFTSIAGQRRLRILNLCFAVGTQMADIYRSAELDAIMSYLAKSSISKVCDSSPKMSREKLFNRCAQILACYRKNVASPTSPGQLILPEQMKLLPLYINCLVRSDALMGGPDLLTDDRAFFMQSVQGMDVLALSVYLYPRLHALHDLDFENEEDAFPMPMRCSKDKMLPHGLYLLREQYLSISDSIISIQI